ncbi:MAG: endo alpha-1,4 polygalactosaminidase [Rhizobiales bacterium]|nr:endo alpha-1,4 polygalactosaminidase [Hyphomicrobiales bacterium]
MPVTPGDDTIYGRAGSDILTGGAGDDVIWGDHPSAGLELSVMAQAEARLGASSFAVLYQGAAYSVAGLSQAPHELVIINPARTIVTDAPGGETLWTSAEIAAIQAGGRKAIGYVNLSKINSFTGMWNAGWTDNGLAGGALASSAPSWLGAVDPAYANTRFARYWESGWKDALFARVDVLIAQGFDGLFLDDVLGYFNSQGPGSNALAAAQMRDLIIELGAYADGALRLARGAAYDVAQFKIIANGAVYILSDGASDAAHADAYRAVVDAVLVENYFTLGQQAAISKARTDFGAHGVALLSVDTDRTTVQDRIDVMAAATLAGFLPYATATSAYDVLNAPYAVGFNGPDGADRLDGGPGGDTMYGRGGDDAYVVDDPRDRVIERPGEGLDTVEASLTYRMSANVENLVLMGVATIGGVGNDLANDIKGNDGANALSGLGGADTIHGGLGADNLDGGAGDDFLYGEGDNDGFRAGAGADLFDGGDGVDAVNYSTGTSTVVYLDGSGANAAAAAGDTLVSIENLVGSATGVDVFVGDANANRLVGNGGNDRLTGRGGADILEGGAGADRLVGEDGADVMTGGTEADAFVFNLAPAAGGLDRITDFEHALDRLEIDASLFGGGLVAGGAVNFVSGPTPTSVGFAAGVFLYDTDDGFLYWDADGAGAGARLAIVRLQNLPALTAGDFTVVA